MESTNLTVQIILAGIASMIAGAATHPIDTCKVRLQSQHKHKYPNIIQTIYIIVKQEGFLGLYKGIQPSLLREGSYSALRMGLYEPIKHSLGGIDKTNTQLHIKLIAGLTSGFIGSVMSTPFDLLKVRIQSQHHHQLQMTLEFKQILQQRGLLGLWRGATVNILRGSVLTAAKMATYDHSKHFLLKRGYQDDMLTFFYCSIITGFNLTAITAPLDLVKTRVMVDQDKGIFQIVASIIKNEGLLTFYRGALPNLLRFAPFNVIQLVAWEQLKKVNQIATI